MRHVGPLLWLLAFSFACSKRSSVEASAPQAHSSGTLVETTRPGGAHCLSKEEEHQTDYPEELLHPTMWNKELGITNDLSRPPLTKLPTLAQVKAALKDGFKGIPRRGSWFKAYAAAKPAKIYEKPDSTSLEMGRIEPRTRVAATGFLKGRGCKGGWLRIGFQAFVCLKHFKPTRKPPDFALLPRMKKGALTPGKYSYVRLGGAPWYASRSRVKAGKIGGKYPAGFFVRFKRFTRINGKNYWKTIKNRYIPVDRLARFIPSKHEGTHLQNLTLPVLFPIAKNSKGKGVAIPVLDRPGGTKVATIPYHEAVHIFGEKRAGLRKYYRIGRCRWVASRQVAAAFPSPVPPGVRQGEQWMDINLMRQTLVAYEGHTPVFATIISSGKPPHSTKHGVFRSWWKRSEGDMANEKGADVEYLASAVPWNLFFWKGQALHAAYWHDDFGKKKSHGCVNLAPRDALFLYSWSLPFLGAGWRYRWTGKTHPGITIQVRRNDADRPMVWGLARTFVEERLLSLLDTHYKEAIKKETLEIISEANAREKEESATRKAPKKPHEKQKRTKQ